MDGQSESLKGSKPCNSKIEPMKWSYLTSVAELYKVDCVCVWGGGGGRGGVVCCVCGRLGVGDFGEVEWPCTITAAPAE